MYTYGDTAWGDLLTAYDGVSITYDTMGNPLTDGTWTYTWEHGRQLASMTDGTTTWTYTYDANGLRSKRTNGTDTYTYVYNGSKLMQMKKGAYTLDFTYDASGNPSTVTLNGTTYYYITNLQGDVTEIRDSSGNLVCEYSYDAWGKVISRSDNSTHLIDDLNPLLYRGYVYDTDTGLYYLQSRYYDPAIGRFLNADALVSTGQGILGNNMCAYCNNNPINCADYSGTVPANANFSVCWGGSGSNRPPLTQDIEYMLDAGLEFGVDPVMIATVIAVEQNYNVNIFDLADIPAGLIGVDTSVGFGQVRISTAQLVENANYIEKSCSNWDRVWRLSDKKTNIRYVAAYLAYVRDIWTLQDPDFEKSPGVWWTVYNTGTTHAHPNPGPGLLGEEAEMYYKYYKWLLGR